jgi:hypothetical protein
MAKQKGSTPKPVLIKELADMALTWPIARGELSSFLDQLNHLNFSWRRDNGEEIFTLVLNSSEMEWLKRLVA